MYHHIQPVMIVKAEWSGGSRFFFKKVQAERQKHFDFEVRILVSSDETLCPSDSLKVENNSEVFMILYSTFEQVFFSN